MAWGNLISLVFAAVIVFLASACTRAKPPLSPLTPTTNDYSSGPFSPEKGTTWVYRYDEYEPTTSDPTKTLPATYTFTETVVDTQVIPPYTIAHVKRTEQLVNADPGWVFTGSGRPAEFWYVRAGDKVYQSNLKLDLADIQLDTMILDYDFPLTVGKSWCLTLGAGKGQKIVDCSRVNNRSVESQGSYTTPASEYENCYQLIDAFNDGDIIQWFCEGIGMVAEKFDHAGTKFGYSEVLIGYTRGSP